MEIRLGPKHSDGKRELNVYDICLEVYRQKGDSVEEDVSCDSKFMLSVMDDVGKAI